MFWCLRAAGIEIGFIQAILLRGQQDFYVRLMAINTRAHEIIAAASANCEQVIKFNCTRDKSTALAAE